MKITSVIVTAAVAVLLQMVFARYMVGGRWLFDLVLVGVVYAALTWGPAAGILVGTGGGLIQDALSGGIVGVGGLAKTIVGFAVGGLGAQFVITRPPARALLAGGATILHRMVILSLNGLIDQHWLGISWTAMLVETLVNALLSLLAFQATESLPGAIARGRQGRRSSLSRRRW